MVEAGATKHVELSILAFDHMISQTAAEHIAEIILAPVRRDFEQRGMTDEDLAALVEEVREDIWQERHGRPSKTS